MINPYDILRNIGVPNGKITALPQNYAIDLSMNTWWSAVQRARNFSDFTGLDALYSYVMKSSTIVRSAVDKRLRPLKHRTYGVYIEGVENERLTELLKDSPLFRELIYQRGLANFTYARVIGVNRDLSTFVYPLRNLDTVNKAIKKQTYNVQGDIRVQTHVNLFWVQTDYKSEDTLGLLEPICRDYINMVNAQNNWQTASQFQAYKQLVAYYEKGDPKMRDAAQTAAESIGLGNVIVTGKTTDEVGKNVIKDIELVNVGGGDAADTFRIFKENIEQLRGSIMQLVLGSSLLGMSDKNTNSERLVRAHLKLFRDITESDAIEVQDWLNTGNVLTKLAYLMGEPDLERAVMKVKPSNYIDIGDVETYTNMISDLGLSPTEGFIEKSGLDITDVTGYENSKNVVEGSKGTVEVHQNERSGNNIARMAVEFTKRLFNRNRPGNR